MMVGVQIPPTQYQKKGNEMNKLFMMVGLVGSGKSTIAEKYAKIYNAKIHSSDKIREEWFGDEAIQGDNSKIFEELHKRVRKDLLVGNVIIDATNLSAKKRASFLKSLNNIECEKICIVVIAPYQLCIKRDLERDRTVGENVIMKMLKNFQMPMLWEGWEDIVIENTYDGDADIGDYLDYHIIKSTGFNQENTNHTLTLDRHLYKAYSYAVDKNYNNNIEFAALYHDIGKSLCKSHINRKNEYTANANYYGHENASAYIFLSLFCESKYPDLHEKDLIYITNLINNHMLFYQIRDYKDEMKYKTKFGVNFFEDLVKLNKCDKFAH